MNSRKYYFLEYLERKRKLEENASKRKRKYGMEKSVKITNNRDKKISAADIFESLKEKVNPEDITAISPLGGNREFVVSFQDQEIADRMVGESLTINDEIVYIFNANKDDQIFKIKAVIKIHWLPPGQDWQEIEDLFGEIDTLVITEKSPTFYPQISLFARNLAEKILKTAGNQISTVSGFKIKYLV